MRHPTESELSHRDRSASRTRAIEEAEAARRTPEARLATLRTAIRLYIEGGTVTASADGWLDAEDLAPLRALIELAEKRGAEWERKRTR